ncbi:MAG: hypothetical protein K6L80_03375 [Agarilytica sp.]
MTFLFTMVLGLQSAQVSAQQTSEVLGYPPVNVYAGYVLARPQAEDQDGTDEEIEDQRLLDDEGNPLAPVGRVKLYTGAGTNGFTYSNDLGEYALAFYGPPCPSFFYTHRDIITAEFYPDLRPRYPIFTLANTYIPISVRCFGLNSGFTFPNIISLTNHLILDSIYSSVGSSSVAERLNIFMDTMFVFGAVQIQQDGINIPIATPTTYDAGGLLTQISEDDLLNTDIFIYNQRTNQIIANNSFSPIIRNGSAATTTFQIPIFGPDYNLVYRSLSENGALWSPSAPPEIIQAAERARPGDPITIYAVNRTTGYMGYVHDTLESIGLEASPDDSDDITVAIINMEPPNLKVTADRRYDIERGSTSGEERQYLIGFEGSALKDDELIRLTTEWTSPDGTPIPPGIPGYTGRIARIVDSGGNSEISSALSEIATFDINPGFSQQWIYNPAGGFIRNGDHLYMHVCAEASGSGNTCDFEMVSDPSDPLSYRPINRMPMQVLEFGSRVNSLGNVVANDTDGDGISNIYEQQLGFDPNSTVSSPPDSDNDGIPDAAWIYRPEMSFSIYDLTLHGIELTHEGGATSVDIFSLTDDPVISWEDQQVDILYRLDTPNYAGATLTELPRLGVPREFVFSFANQTVAATLDQDTQALFDDLSPIQEALQQSSPEEYLAFRLFQTSDLGNVLWEFGFDRGLHVFYKIPHDETEIFIEPDSGNNLIRTLGGMRLKYEYYIPTGATLEEITWNFNAPGRFCPDYGVDITGCTDALAANLDHGGTGALASARREVYWEPVDTSIAGNPALWSDSFTTLDNVNSGSSALLTVSYSIDGVSTTEQIPFTVTTRIMRPSSNSVPLISGSDVEMLETMLWQFGLSPQKGVDLTVNSWAGEQGNRINSDRGNGNGWILNCDNGLQANSRNTYRGSWGSCAANNVSLEGMVRRLQGRTLATCTRNVSVCTNDYAGNTVRSNGVVDNQFLGTLVTLWPDYWRAYSLHTTEPVIDLVDSNWIASGVTHWNGTYTGSPGGAHEQVLAASGQLATFTREGLLNSWVQQEASVGHWGQGRPQTDFRISEGGADEFGSIGLSQIKYSFRYGNAGRCAALNNSNLFSPSGSIGGMVIFGSSICNGGFIDAFTTGGAWLTLQSGNADLVGYRQGAGGVITMNAARTDDAYERLMKAIAKYNGGIHLNQQTWGNLLTIGHRMQNGRHVMGGVYSNRTYAMQVMRRYGIPPRTYIWVGNRFPDVDPNTGLPHPQAGQPEWCFEFGEEEWMNGEQWATALLNARSTNILGLPQTPVGRTPCP